MSFNKNNLSLVVFFVLIFSYLFFIFHAWIIPQGVLSYADALYFYPSLLLSWFTNLSFSWFTYIDLGSNNAYVLNQFFPSYLGGLFAFLGIDYSLSERIIFFIPIVIISVLGSFFLLKKLLKTTNYIILGIPILLFIFNPSSYFFFKWPKIALAYVFIPLALWSFMKFLEKRTNTWMYSFIFIFFITFLDMRMGFFAALFILLYFLGKLIVGYPLSRSLINQFIFIGIIFLLLSSFFVLPLVIKTNQASIGTVTGRDVFGLNFYNLSYALTTYHPFWTGSTIEVFTVHPIIFFFWFLPIFAFGALFYAKKNKAILYFTAIALFGIFMGKGSDVPLRNAYQWLYGHLIFFDFNRDPSRWYVLTVIAYVILIGYFLYYTFLYLDKVKSTFLRFICKTLVTVPLLVIIASIAAPTFTGAAGWIFTAYTIPQEYNVLNSYLLQNKQFSRTLSVPDIQRYALMDNTHPAVSFMDLSEDMSTLNTKLLNLMAVKYIIMPDDPLQDLYKWFGSREEFSLYIHQNIQNNSWSEKKIGDIALWQNKTNPMPHIMSVSDVIYVTGTVGLKDIISLPTGRQYAYYFEQPAPANNEPALIQASQIDAVANCILCDIDNLYSTSDIFPPYARILPDSALYPFIIWKENRSLNSVSLDQKAKKSAFYASKRVVELQGLVNNGAKLVYMQESVNRLISELALINQYVATLPSNPSDNATNSNLAYIGDYLTLEGKILQGISNTATDKDTLTLMQIAGYKTAKLLDIVGKKAWESSGDKRRYTASIPSAGKYTVLIKEDSESNLVQNSIMADKQILYRQNAKNGFINYGNITLSQGTFPIELTAKPVNLIASNSAKVIIPANAYSSYVSIPIKKLSDPLSNYQVSFDYKTSDGLSTIIAVQDDYHTSLHVSGNIFSKIVGDTYAGRWAHFTGEFKPTYGISHPHLLIKVFQAAGDTTQLQVENISITKVANPIIVFNKQQTENTIPSITFKENTPVDYTVLVHNAQKPFVLSFSEGYDSGWKMSLDNTTSPFTESAGANTTQYNSKEIINNSFTNPFGVFAYVFAPQVQRNQHLRLNSFGNGWVVDKKGTYTLHIYFFPQVIFLAGLGVSTITAFVIIYLLMRALRKKNTL